MIDVLLDAFDEDVSIGGRLLSGALAYRLFLFMLPLAFLLIAMLGLVADAINSTPRRLGSDFGFLGLVTNDVARTSEEGSRVWVALVALGALFLATRTLYRSVVVVHALAWDHTAAGARWSGRALGLFALGLVLQIALSAAISTAYVRSFSGTLAESVAYAGLSACLWLGISLLLSHSTARWPALVPGSLLYGAGALAIHAFNASVLTYVHGSRSSTYGTLGSATAVLLSLYFVGRLVVVAAVLNATLAARRSVRARP